MELQEKFDEIIESGKFQEWSDYRRETTIECTKLCLEEIINELKYAAEQCDNIRQFKAALLLNNKAEYLQQQLKSLEDGDI